MVEETKIKEPVNTSVAFAVDDTPESSKSEKPVPTRRLSKRNSLRSSFFRLKGLSFRRSGGERGADVNTLRGTHGPDFEGYAIIKRSGDVVGVSCDCFGRNDDSKEKIILIKGPYCFVFNKESDPSPKYAISLAHMIAKSHSPSRGVHHVTIENNLGDVGWELGFSQKDITQHFVDAVSQQAAVGESDEVRKRLGHENLLQKRGSVKYAESIAQKKIHDQPEKKEIALSEADKINPMMAVC